MSMKIPAPDFAITPYGDVDAAALTRLRQDFDTALLLELVERLTPVAQRFKALGGLRDDMLRLHRMAHTVLNGANLSEPASEDLWEVAAELIDELRQTAETCLEIASALQPLADLQPNQE
ncbi:Tn3 family transposase post-transcriptional regulator TnpC [Uliginosibacterium paludis]|uniref:Tn3 family transposase post-transcriptional regulator TnpC n=2 Tax=Uliginosibacterium paludis TaxID=1615952 RepID=A0ABV2CLA9_9RHOO